MSAKQSTPSSEDLQLEVAKELLTNNERDLARARVMEKFYTRNMVLGHQPAEMMLGRIQAQIKEWESLHSFLRGFVDAAK